MELAREQAYGGLVEGRQRGLEEGLESGRRQGLEEVARNLLRQGSFSPGDESVRSAPVSIQQQEGPAGIMSSMRRSSRWPT